MRILFVSYEMPPIGGGGGRAMWQIARRLADRHEVHVLTTLFDAQAVSEVCEGVHIHRMRVRRKRADACSPLELLSFMLRSVPAAARLAATIRPHAVCAFFAIPGGPAAWRLKRRGVAPYLLALRGSDVPREELAGHQRLHRFTRPFIRRILHDADGVTAVSEALREAALRLTPDKTVEVIPNGVDADFFSPVEGWPDRAPAGELLYVGRLRDFKVVQHILRALPLIEKQFERPVRLTVVGSGPYEDDLRRLASELADQGMRSEAVFAGWLEPEALREAYRRSSLVILPSLVEGHPNVLLEAMACGLPVVASDVPGCRGVATPETGRLVPPCDAKAIAAAVAEWLKSPPRMARGRSGRAAARGGILLGSRGRVLRGGAAPDCGRGRRGMKHLMFLFVDHFEPENAEQLAAWVDRYPQTVNRFEDADGRSPRHSWFYDKEDASVLEGLAALCRKGFGEVELHLHHGHDTADGLREKLARRKRVYGEHGALITTDAEPKRTFGFIHGKWCLDNSRGDAFCGVNNELIVLKECGCYADFTFPAWGPMQPARTNAIYYATDDPERPKSYDTGVPVAVGAEPSGDLMIVQGPGSAERDSREGGADSRRGVGWRTGCGSPADWTLTCRRGPAAWRGGLRPACAWRGVPTGFL